MKINTQRKKIILLGVVAILLGMMPQFVQAQTGNLTGTVIDESSDEALPGVNIFLQESKGGLQAGPMEILR